MSSIRHGACEAAQRLSTAKNFEYARYVVGEHQMANYSASESAISRGQDSEASNVGDQLDSAGQAIINCCIELPVLPKPIVEKL
jgi:hypothetical protein